MQGTAQRLGRIDAIVASTRPAVFVRRADSLLLIRPDKAMGLNHSAVEILSALYAPQAGGAGVTLEALAPRLGVASERLLADTETLIDAVAAVMNEDFTPRPGLSLGAFGREAIAFPTLAEIALTYRCNNACRFCYAASPERGDRTVPMQTAEVERVMTRIATEAQVPSLSFTGGEATLRPDLPRLIAHGKGLGLRMNLITNGLRAGHERYAAELVEAGLDSAQVSLEAAQPELHDYIVGRPGAHARTVAAVRNFARLGIHVHTNSTLCRKNLDVAADLIRFVARDLERRTLSMNMLIRTGSALGEHAVSYAEVGALLPQLIEVAKAEGVRLVWYSPIPYCIFNPVEHGLGAKSCACVDGILSVDPSGQMLPCSSFEQGIGSLLDRPFARLYRSGPARYWRKKRFVPPSCRGCRDEDICGGACPLYWDAAGTFAELPGADSDDARARARWERERRRSGSFGVAQAEDAAEPACCEGD